MHSSRNCTFRWGARGRGKPSARGGGWAFLAGDLRARAAPSGIRRARHSSEIEGAPHRQGGGLTSPTSLAGLAGRFRSPGPESPGFAGFLQGRAARLSAAPGALAKSREACRGRATRRHPTRRTAARRPGATAASRGPERRAPSDAAELLVRPRDAAGAHGRPSGAAHPGSVPSRPVSPLLTSGSSPRPSSEGAPDEAAEFESPRPEPQDPGAQGACTGNPRPPRGGSRTWRARPTSLGPRMARAVPGPATS